MIDCKKYKYFQILILAFGLFFGGQACVNRLSQLSSAAPVPAGHGVLWGKIRIVYDRSIGLTPTGIFIRFRNETNRRDYEFQGDYSSDYRLFVSSLPPGNYHLDDISFSIMGSYESRFHIFNLDRQFFRFQVAAGKLAYLGQLRLTIDPPGVFSKKVTLRRCYTFTDDYALLKKEYGQAGFFGLPIFHAIGGKPIDIQAKQDEC